MWKKGRAYIYKFFLKKKKKTSSLDQQEPSWGPVVYLLNAQQQDGSCGVEGRGDSPGKREKMAIKKEKGKKEKHTNKKKEARASDSKDDH